MDNEANALEYVCRYVKSGFYSSDEITEIVGQDVFEGAIPPSRLHEMITEAYREKLADQATWPAKTDCDRLDEVFESLEQNGVLALQNAGNTQSDGLSNVSQLYVEAGGEASGIDGFCFYHGQDLDCVMESGQLWLAFGAANGDPAKEIEIGNRIKDTFEEGGFEIEWDGSAKTRLLVKGILWQRRGEPIN